MITIADCKLQCNLLEDEVDFDSWFDMAIPAAIGTIETQLDRKLYDTQTSLDEDINAPVNAMAITNDLKMGLLMLLAHWFNNRESTSALSLFETPMALTTIIQSHRNLSL